MYTAITWVVLSIFPILCSRRDSYVFFKGYENICATFEEMKKCGISYEEAKERLSQALNRNFEK